MTSKALHLVLSAPLSISQALVIIILLVLLVGHITRRGCRGLRPREKRIILFLRFGSLLALLSLSFGPKVLWSRGGVWETIPILLDVSQSMSVKDDDGSGSRSELAADLLSRNPTGLLYSLASMGPVQVMAFGESLRPIETSLLLERQGILPDAISPKDASTKIADSLDEVRKTLPSRSSPGLILITDGIDNGGRNPLSAAQDFGAPIYTIQVGKTDANAPSQKDLSIQNVQAPRTVLLGDSVSGTASISAIGFQNIKVPLEVYCDGLLCATSEANLSSSQKTVQIPFTFLPRQAGNIPCQVRIGEQPNERTSANNQQLFNIQVVENQIRVLYLEGAIRWEYKFLRRYLESDSLIRTTFLLRTVADVFQISQSSADASGSDLANLTAAELLADLSKFDVIMLGDIDSAALTAAQMDQIRLFVSKGGGLIMLGGRHTFGLGGYRDTPLAEALPVKIGGREEAFISKPGALALTSDGMSHPAMKGFSVFFAPESNSPLRSIESCNRVLGVKPGAVSLLDTLKESQPVVVLASQNYGSGRSMALTADSTWKWAFSLPASGQQTPYSRFWGQILRWLASKSLQEATGQRSVQLSIDRSNFMPGDEAHLRVRVQGDYGQPLAGGKLRARLKPVSFTGDEKEIDLTEFAQSPGIFEGFVELTSPGTFEILVTGEMGKGEVLGRDYTRIEVKKPSEELDLITPNEVLLKGMASVSQGQFFHYEEAFSLVDALVSRSSSGVVSAERGIGPDSLWLVVFLIFCAGEWFVRRRRNLI